MNFNPPKLIPCSLSEWSKDPVRGGAARWFIFIGKFRIKNVTTAFTKILDILILFVYESNLIQRGNQGEIQNEYTIPIR